MKEVMSSNYNRQIRNVLVFMLVILTLYVLKIAQEVTLPIAIALFIFCFANPVMDRLTRLKVPNILAIAIVMLLILGIFLSMAYVIYVMVNMLLPKIDVYARRLVDIDTMISTYLVDHLDNMPEDFSVLAFLNVDWVGMAKNYLASISSKVISIASDSMIIFVTVLFLLLERTTFLPKVTVAFPKDKSQRLINSMGRINKQITKYLFLKTIISAVTGVLFYLAALSVGLDFALIWGVLAFVLNFIPTIGSIIVTVLTIFMSIVQFFPDPMKPLYIMTMTIGIEMVVGNIIDPRLQGVQLNISPFVILVALSVWGYIWGIVGMFLAVPLVSILQIVCAVVPSLRPIAVFLSSGKSYIREYKEMEEDKKKKGIFSKLKKEESEESNGLGDIILPDRAKKENSEK